jgi:hypothetical protein
MAWDSVAGPWRSVISADGWKLNLSAIDQCELYDLHGDPHEQVNLFDDPCQRTRVRDLTTRLRLWQERMDDGVSVLPT